MKYLFKKIGWLFTLSVILFAGCQKDNELFTADEAALNTGITKAAVTGYDYLGNANGVFVLSEGNMMDENGTLSFIDASGSPSGSFPAQNWVFGSPSSLAMGNVSQDLFIANNQMYILAQNGNSVTPNGAKHILKLNNTLEIPFSFNPSDIFPTGWGATTPTHLAVTANRIYVRTNSAVIAMDLNGNNLAPIQGITNSSRTRMAMVKNNNVKYLYVGSEDGIVYRINTSVDPIFGKDAAINVGGKIAGLVAVRRNNNATQYICAEHFPR